MQWNYAFDPGSETIRMVMRGLDGMYTEEDCAAYRSGSNMPFSRGEQAAEFLGRQVTGVELKRCFSKGIPQGYAFAARWLRRIISLHEKKLPGQKTVLFSASPCLGEAERGMFMKALLNEETDAVGCVDSDIAALLGAGIDVIDDSSTRVVIDFGNSMISCSVLSGGIRVKYEQLSIGIEELIGTITDCVFEKTGMLIGRKTAILLRNNFAERDDIECPAFNPNSGLPAHVVVSTLIIKEAVKTFISYISDLFEHTVQWLPEGCAIDILNNGIIITGGGASLSMLKDYLSEKINTPITIAANPSECIIRGIKAIIDNSEKYGMFVTDWRDAGMKE